MGTTKSKVPIVPPLNLTEEGRQLKTALETQPIRLTQLPNGDWTANLQRPPPPPKMEEAPYVLNAVDVVDEFDLDESFHRSVSALDDPRKEGLRRLCGNTATNTLSDQCAVCGEINDRAMELCPRCGNILVNVPGYDEEKIWQTLTRARKMQNRRSL